MIPNDFPKWELVYYYYSKWANAEDFDLLLAKRRFVLIEDKKEIPASKLWIGNVFDGSTTVH